MITSELLSQSSNSWCVLLSALSKASSFNPQESMDCKSCHGAELKMGLLPIHEKPLDGKDLVDLVDGCTPPQAAKIILDLMSYTHQIDRDREILVPRPNSQAYCLVASAFSHTAPVKPDFAISLFKNATVNGQKVDGRFLNAVIRCYGDNISNAVDAWKHLFRPAVFNALTIDRSSIDFQKSRVYKNLVAAYHGLIYVAGRAYRPDIALRLVYAMAKEGVEPTEAALNTYNKGAMERNMDMKKIKFHGQYENLLLIECTKYDSKDKRRQADKRVRIIL
jgi:hypothetical protein